MASLLADAVVALTGATTIVRRDNEEITKADATAGINVNVIVVENFIVVPNDSYAYRVCLVLECVFWIWIFAEMNLLTAVSILIEPKG